MSAAGPLPSSNAGHPSQAANITSAPAASNPCGISAGAEPAIASNNPGGLIATALGPHNPNSYLGSLVANLPFLRPLWPHLAVTWNMVFATIAIPMSLQAFLLLYRHVHFCDGPAPTNSTDHGGLKNRTIPTCSNAATVHESRQMFPLVPWAVFGPMMVTLIMAGLMFVFLGLVGMSFELVIWITEKVVRRRRESRVAKRLWSQDNF